ncbi:MAG: DUF4912 domain-containing protein, partial [Sphaerospermopsis sp. SIO1G2]|nr:DUF4912 domain-containing protein [Sphaerospermopsis sp. SIO1G2]
LAIENLLDGKIDIAAIGRELTPEEKDQGLEQVILHREKIVIIVSVDNPFLGSLTSQQFAQIFRGEITNWSELGGEYAKIRFIDHPENSDVRNTFRTYPSFQSAEFASGNNVTQVGNNQVNQIVKELGKEGISYALANQVTRLSDVKVLEIDGLKPNQYGYPFVQPLVYVYKQNPRPAVEGFLDYTRASEGENVITLARAMEGDMIAARKLQNLNFTSQNTSNQPLLTARNSDNTVNSGSEQPFFNLVNNSPFEDKTLILLITLSSLPIIVFACVLAWWLKKTQTLANHNNDLLESQDQGLTYINSNTSAVTEIPEENLIIDPFNADHKTIDKNQNQIPDDHSNGNSTVVNTDDHLVYISQPNSIETTRDTNGKTQIKTNKVLQNPAEAKTAIQQNQVEKTNISQSHLDVAEVLWDTEAPVAVVNSSYQSVSNITQIPANYLQIPTDEDIDRSLSELLNEETDIPSTEQDTLQLVNGLNGNSNIVAEDSYTSLSDLLNDDIDVLSNQEATNVLQEIINSNPNLLTQKSEISLADLLNENTNLSGDETKSLLEKIGVIVDRNHIDPNIPLSELLDIFSQSTQEYIESNHQDLKSLLPPTNESNSESVKSLADLLGLSTFEEEKQNSDESNQEETQDKTQKLLSKLSNEFNEVFNELENETDINTDLARELSVNLPIASQNIPHSTVREDLRLENTVNIEEFSSLNYTQISEITIADNSKSNVVLTPRTPKWAYVSWYVSPSHKEIGKDQGGNLLMVRLYDATDLDLSYETPQLVQQYECEEIICDCYISIPTSNRDYLAEIGYVTRNNTWLCLARSGKVRIFSRPSGDLWFVADTELVIHGSTEPGATVTIGGSQIQLQPDGTFHLRVPFSENLLQYMMTATTADGESSITILKKFFQENSSS